MVMRKFIILLAIMVFTTCIWAQTELEENTAQDTINIEIVVIDTLEEKVDPKLLLVEMNNFLEEKREIEDDLFLPHLIYKENFHLSSPFNLNMRITKNGFSEIPFATGNLQTVQNNRSIFKTIYKRGNIFYNSWEYSLPAAITETYMGLGDNDMNNIAVSLMKGSIFGIPNLDMQLDFLGEKGIWLDADDETSQNFHLHLSYDLDFARIHFDNSIIDQTLPGEKDIYSYSYPFDSASNKENEYSIIVENKVIDLGIKYKTNDYKITNIQKKRGLLQFLTQKNIETKDHKLDFSYEYVVEDNSIQNTMRDSSYHILSFDQDSKFMKLNIGNTGYFQDKNIFQLNSEVAYEIFNGFSLLGEYCTSSSNSFNNYYKYKIRSRVGGGILFHSSHLKTKIMLGQNSNRTSGGLYPNIKNSVDYFEVQNLVDLSFNNKFKINVRNWLRNEEICEDWILDYHYNDDIEHYPEWQLSNQLELRYLLEHNNAIKLGLKHIYHSSYSYTLGDLETIFENDTQNIDAYLKIQLTDRFEISIDAVNLTNNKIMFTNYNHPGTHFNVNVHWIFVN